MLVLGTPGLRDPWFAEDKLKHFFASFVVTSLGASVARAAGAGSTNSIYFGATLSGTAGLLKEGHDRRRGSFFSLPDLAWAAAGTGAGIVLLREAR